MTYKVVLLSFSEKTEWGPLCLHANVKVGNIRAMDSELFFYSNYDCKNYANRKVEYNIPLCEYYKKNCRDIKSPVWYAMLAKM